MPITQTDASAPAEEYEVLAREAGWNHRDEGEALESLKASLVEDAEWTPRAAEELARLATTYGSFFLRNALALSVALGIEDGEAGF